MIARHVIVHGRVQGVFYRAEAQRTAGQLGVRGWVRNRPDGSVEATIEGEQASVDQMVQWMRTGPARAHVDGVDVSETTPSGMAAFEVQ